MSGETNREKNSETESITSKSRELQRRQFLASTAASVGVMATSSVSPACLAGEFPQQQGQKSQSTGDEKYVSLKDAHAGTPEIDLRIMNQFEDQPRAVQDFYLACRNVLTSGKSAQETEAELADVCRKFKRNKLGGPMLGDLGSTHVSVWMHLPAAQVVKVVVTPKNGGEAQTFESDKKAFTSVRCEGLTPDSAYDYSVLNSKGESVGKGQFITAPVELTKEPFRIAFGADFHKIGMYRPELMGLARERGARAMLLIGDLAVDGRKADFGLINTDYMLRNLSPPIQKLTANVPVTATWDDHDYWGNDASGTLTKSKKPIDVVGLRRMWKKQWNNPQRDVDRAGIYFETKIGPVHYIALDTRSCRVDAEQGKLNSFLGDEQTKWLQQTLANSTASFIVISGGTMWTDYISAGKDSWGKWDVEGREAIFEWIDQKKDSQVFLLSGDRHGARGFKIPREGARDIYEFEIGTLGGVPGPKAFGKDRSTQLFGLRSKSWAFGELTFSLADGKPQAVFRLINTEGKILEALTVKV
ncbi:alkaline phosphatase D family protein [Mariniblastus sp.]|nr:alkaline phosphatase D family protein [Mariniblastus sp.]